MEFNNKARRPRLLSLTQQMMQSKMLLKLQEQAARAGLRMSTKKSKVMRINRKSTKSVTVNG